MDQLTTEDVDNTASLFTEQINPVDLQSDYEQLQRQVEELTKQLNQSQSEEKHANDEREKYAQLYNQTNEGFFTIENQLRRILHIVTSRQHQTPSKQSSTNSLPLLLEEPLDQSTTETDLLKQISEIMDTLENFVSQSSEENVKLHFDVSSLRTEYEKEKRMRHHFEKQFNEANNLIELDHSKRLQKLRNYASLADDEGDILLSSLMKKAEKNDADFREMKLQYEDVFLEQVNQMKKLVKERELLHLYIQRLERENALLAARTHDDETIQSLTYSSQTLTSYEECLVLIEQLREVIIEQLKIQDKLKNDKEQLISNHQTEIREREQIEEYFDRDLTAAKDKILVLESVRSDFDHMLIVKNNLQREVEEYKNELTTMKTVFHSLIDHLKEQTEEISLEKERLDEENVILREQAQQLKMDFQNSESVQHDFVKLSQALQVQLEEFRNSANELRWQHDEDFSECQRCHLQFSMTWRKQHCYHCGKVLCKECVTKTVSSGPNKRSARVCDVCYTLLNKTSQPYFLDGVPKV